MCLSGIDGKEGMGKKRGNSATARMRVLMIDNNVSVLAGISELMFTNDQSAWVKHSI